MNPAVRKYMAEIGRKGGKATGPSKARTSEQAKAAVQAREAKRKARQSSLERSES